MEMIGNEGGNAPKSYCLNMSKDFVPMCIFSGSSQGEECGSLVSLSRWGCFYFKLIIITRSMLCLIWYFAGKVAMEGKVEHKFDMKPDNRNMEEYSKLCRERTNRSMIKNRQIQVE